MARYLTIHINVILTKIYPYVLQHFETIKNDPQPLKDHISPSKVFGRMIQSQTWDG